MSLQFSQRRRPHEVDFSAAGLPDIHHDTISVQCGIGIPLRDSVCLLTMSQPKSLYDVTRSKARSGEEFYKQTVARIQKIQSHFTSSPRRRRLNAKVCVITGVGSLKGIGYVYISSFLGLH